MTRQEKIDKGVKDVMVTLNGGEMTVEEVIYILVEMLPDSTIDAIQEL